MRTTGRLLGLVNGVFTEQPDDLADDVPARQSLLDPPLADHIGGRQQAGGTSCSRYGRPAVEHCAAQLLAGVTVTHDELVPFVYGDDETTDQATPPQMPENASSS